MAICSAPAHAGHWQFSAAGSTDTSTVHVEGVLQTQTPPPTPWSPPSTPSDNSLTLTLPGASASDTNLSNNPNCDCTATASLKITVNWVTDSTSDNTPPTSVWLCENSSASWAAGPGYGARKTVPTQPGQPTPPPAPGTPTVYGGTASNASSDPYVPSPPASAPTSGSSTLSATQTAPPDGWQSYPVTGTQVVLPVRTVTATGNVTGGTIGKVTVTCSLAYSITIHAQPYNFRRVPGQGKIGIDGNIDWVYNYSSTDGNPNDLTTCTWHEHLTYPGGQVGTQASPNKYYPPSPPFGYPASGTAWFNNPDFGTDVSLVPSPAGSSPEIDDITFVPAFLKPYVYGTFSTTQVFEFNDSATGDKNVQIPGPDSGPFTIVRTVKYVDPTHYEYDVSKASVSDTLSLPD